MQDCGIYRKIAEPYLNAEPLLTLPKVRDNEALGPDQLVMLWLIWACGVILGTLAFLVEARRKLVKLYVKAKMVRLVEKILG